MGAREDTRDYRQLFLSDAPMMDTRAPLEFSQGAFPSAHSLPLMSDEERHQVGIRYKEQGQQAAIELGQALVSGEMKAQRLAQWCDFARSHPLGYVYCFRGGLRSQTVQQWMRAAGVEYPLVLGGYKAMRRFLLENLEQASAQGSFVLVGGKTGTGKTRVIEALQRSVDLEGLAHHRGSTFGQLLEDQPGQIDFENALSIALLKLLDSSDDPVVLEDEGRLVGRVYLPECLREKMQQSPLLVVEESVESRVQVILEDYVEDLGRRYRAAHGEQGPGLHRDKMIVDLAKIQKRLGGVAHAEAEAQMRAAFAEEHSSGDTSAHRVWIEQLLLNYYDPMYEYQMSRREGQVLGRGTRQEILEQARALSPQPC
jgi:tRNA 2-selenouridine synthase